VERRLVLPPVLPALLTLLTLPYPTYTPAPSSGGLLWPSGWKDNVISWQDADQYYGQTMTVEGAVVETYNSGKVVFLNFHQDYQDHLQGRYLPR